MKDERLQEIREYASELFNPHRLGDVATVELLAYVDQLTQQRDDARRIAIDYGAFDSTLGDIMWRGEQ